MSDEAATAAAAQAGPDDALLGERVQFLLKLDDLNRQDRDLAHARRSIKSQRRTLEARLDEIVAELRGRQAARQAAPASKDAQ